MSVKLPPWYKYYYKQEAHGLEFWTRLVCIWRITPVETILMSVARVFLKIGRDFVIIDSEAGSFRRQLSAVAQPTVFFSCTFTLSRRSTTGLKVFLAFLATADTK